MQAADEVDPVDAVVFPAGHAVWLTWPVAATKEPIAAVRHDAFPAWGWWEPTAHGDAAAAPVAATTSRREPRDTTPDPSPAGRSPPGTAPPPPHPKPPRTSRP